MGFFKSILKVAKAVLPVVVGVATGNPALGAAVGAGLGATGGGGIKGAVMGGISGYAGTTAATALIGAGSSALAASGANLAAGAAGPVTSGFGTARVFANAALGSVSSSFGVNTAVNAVSTLNAVGGILSASSGVKASKAAAQGGTLDATAPQNDPASVAAANAAADEERRRGARGSAANILTSPLGIGRSGLSASRMLLG